MDKINIRGNFLEGHRAVPPDEVPMCPVCKAVITVPAPKGVGIISSYGIVALAHGRCIDNILERSPIGGTVEIDTLDNL